MAKEQRVFRCPDRMASVGVLFLGRHGHARIASDDASEQSVGEWPHAAPFDRGTDLPGGGGIMPER
jgi:hypothetical protein